jgi:hypothetical protein
VAVIHTAVNKQETPMANQLHKTPTRATITLIATAVGIGLFASGVWAGSAGGGSERPTTVQARGFFWHFDAQTGNPVGPAGQPDFWNYDPQTGAKISDYSPGVAPNDLAALWSVDPWRRSDMTRSSAHDDKEE